jgi:hypothetical protein
MNILCIVKNIFSIGKTFTYIKNIIFLRIKKMMYKYVNIFRKYMNIIFNLHEHLL